MTAKYFHSLFFIFIEKTMRRYLYILIEGIKLFFILPFALTSKKVFERCWNRYYAKPLGKNIFNLCVQWLLYQGKRLGLGYERINVIIFCIVWPVITLASFLLNVILAAFLITN